MDAGCELARIAMRWTPLALISAVLATTVVAFTALGAGGLGIGEALGAGETTHVTVVDSSRLGAMAGLATTTTTHPLGLPLGGGQVPTTAGWVVVAPHDQEIALGAPWETTDRFPFTDPNGQAWEAFEASTPTGPVWFVELGETTYDATLDADYNWALVVDWDQVPEDASLTVHVVDDVPVGV